MNTNLRTASDDIAPEYYLFATQESIASAKAKIGGSYEKRLLIGFFVGWLGGDTASDRTFSPNLAVYTASLLLFSIYVQLAYD